MYTKMLSRVRQKRKCKEYPLARICVKKREFGYSKRMCTHFIKQIVGYAAAFFRLQIITGLPQTLYS